MSGSVLSERYHDKVMVMFKKFFNRPKRERGVSRIQEGMLIHTLKSDHGHYIPWLHTPWLHYFGLTAKPVARLVEDGYLVQDRHAGWYSITLKGKTYIREMLENGVGNANVRFVTAEEIEWFNYLKKLRESDFAISIEDSNSDFVPVKVGP